MHQHLNNIESKWQNTLHDAINRIIVDADSSPVVQEVITVAAQYALNVLLVKDFAHFSNQDLPPFVEVKYVDTGNDSADYEIKRLSTPQDIVITGDYGLASLLINNCLVLHHNGKLYTQDNIDMLLLSRYHNQIERKAGNRIKGPASFKQKDRNHFITTLKSIIEKNLA